MEVDIAGAVVDGCVDPRRGRRRVCGDGLPVAPTGHAGAAVAEVLQVDAGEPCGAAECHQALRVRSEPVVDLTTEFVALIKLEQTGAITSVRRRQSVGDKRFDKSGIVRQCTDLFQAEKWVPQVIQHTKKQNDIEAPEALGRQLFYVEDVVFDA